jgi:hypothetical protein
MTTGTQFFSYMNTSRLVGMASAIAVKNES